MAQRDETQWVTCPTCNGKGTKGMDKNGPKPCPLCTKTQRVGHRRYPPNPGYVRGVK